jgi:hypothetical protein
MVEFRIRNRRLQSSKLLPVAIEQYCCPRIARADLKESILESIGLDFDEIYFEDLGK